MLARRPKVLVIDDSETILDFTRAALEDAGYDVVALTSAALFPATLNREKPDVALIDVAMPVVDGQSLVSLARRNQLHRCVIALYSGQTEDALKRMTTACGADGFIRKSADAQVLLRNVERLLQLPLSNDAPPAAPSAAPAAARAALPEGEAVLVVQSGPALPRELEQAIRASGGAPLLCGSSSECLSALKRRPPLACLVDSAFDGRRGEALCEAIKGEPGHAGVPVIMLGADSSRQLMASWRAGADDFLAQPLKVEQLIGKLNQLRAARRAPAPRERHRHALLLVAPDAAQRGRLGTLLEVSGYGLLYARSAGEGLRLLEQNAAAVGVVVVDLDGEAAAPWSALLPQMRQRFRGPLVALTARDELARRLKDASLAPCEVVPSHLALEQVVKRINNCVHAVPADLQAHLRVPHFSVVEFRAAGAQTWKSGLSFDLSPAGVFLRTLTPEPKGTLLELELQLTAFGARSACSGVVAWSNPFGSMGALSCPTGIGVQFVGLAPEVNAQIARIVRAVGPGSPAGALQRGSPS